MLLNAMDFAGGTQVMVLQLVDRPGSLSFMRSQGRVIKGKSMPGHMGADQACYEKS